MQQWGGQGGHWAKSRGPLSAGVPEFQAKKIKIMFPLQRVKLLTDLQILGCELHKNAFGGRAQSGPAGGAIILYYAIYGSTQADKYKKS